MTILVVDDSASVRDRLVQILSALPGVDCVATASHAAEAVQMLQREPPAAIILDVHMPGGSGLQVLEAIQARRDEILAIVMTNDPTPHWREACRRNGADAFFDKSKELELAVDLIGRAARVGSSDAAGLESQAPPDTR